MYDLYVCMYVCMYVCRYAMYVCMYVCMYLCMYVCMYLYVCVYLDFYEAHFRSPKVLRTWLSNGSEQVHISDRHPCVIKRQCCHNAIRIHSEDLYIAPLIDTYSKA